MKISDLDMSAIIDVIGPAIVPVIFQGVDRSTPAHVLRERARLNAEIMGRFAAVLYCGDEVGYEVVELVEHFSAYMQVEHQLAMKRFLGPAGGMSRLDAAVADKKP